jgi:hypothetical protein
VRLDRLAGLLVRLAEDRVDEGLELRAGGVALRLEVPLQHHLPPVEPAERRVERVDLVALGAVGPGFCAIQRPRARSSGFSCSSMRQPARLALVPDVEQLVRVALERAGVSGATSRISPVIAVDELPHLARLPAQLLEAQVLLVAAVRARHEVQALVGGLVRAVDAAADDRRRRALEDLLAREGVGALLGELLRVALAVDVGRILLDLVEEQVADRARLELGRGVRAGEEQHAAVELLQQDRVAAVARLRLAHLARAGSASPRSSARCACATRASPRSTSAARSSSGRGAWSMIEPIQLLPVSVPPICVGFWNTTTGVGSDGESASMISRRYGVRSVLQRPGSAEAFFDRMRCSSAHSLTVRSGSSARPSANALLQSRLAF